MQENKQKHRRPLPGGCHVQQKSVGEMTDLDVINGRVRDLICIKIQHLQLLLVCHSFGDCQSPCAPYLQTTKSQHVWATWPAKNHMATCQACTAVLQERWILSAGVNIGLQEACKMVSKQVVEALNTCHESCTIIHQHMHHSNWLVCLKCKCRA